MELIDVLRKAAIDLIMRQQGTARNDPRLHAAQKGASGHEATIQGWPVDISNQSSLQVTDPGADFGDFYYMPDYDDPGGGGGPIR